MGPMAKLGTSGSILAAHKASPGIKKAGRAHVLTCKPGERVGGFFSSEGRFLFLKLFVYQKYLRINVNLWH